MSGSLQQRNAEARRDEDGAGGPDALGRFLASLSRAFALGGGGVLLGMTGLTIASVLGRGVLGMPLLGDFELVEMGCAVAVFACLPYCQLRRGNVIVDVFTRRAAAQVRRRLDGAGHLALGLIALVLTWRLGDGGLDLRSAGEETMVLGVPLWWAFVPIVLSAALLAATSLHSAWQAIR